MSALIKVFITNLGKYNEGELIGEWVDLPITEIELDKVYERIGINGDYEETFITDYECMLSGVSINEWDSITDLNDIADKLNSLDEYDLQKLEAVIEAQGGDIDWWLDHHNRLDNVIYYPGYTLVEVATELIEEGIIGNFPESLLNYIDYEAFARDLEFDGYTETENGVVLI